MTPYDSIHSISYLTEIRFGYGALAGMKEEMAAVGMTRPLIVSDQGIAAAGLLAALEEAIGAGHPMFLDTPSNPTEAAARAALGMFRDEKCDGLIAFGGGSSIDLAKAVALMVGHDGPLEQYALVRGGAGLIGDGVAPLIAAPTTAGTGSEVGRGAVMTLDSGRKLGLISPRLIPLRAICDPSVLMGIPSKLTAATGMDAFAHCVESYLSPRINPPAEGIALDGVRRLTRWLEAAVADGSDRAARWETMMAALQGGLTFQKGLGAVHGLSHALGAYKKVFLHHGLLNAVLLPPVLRYNQDTASQKFDQLRQAMGLQAKADLADAVASLNGRIGLPETLCEYALPSDLVAPMAANAMDDHCTATNPRAMSEAAYADIFESIRT